MAAKRTKAPAGLIPVVNIQDAVAPAGWAEEFSELLTRDTASATGGSGWPWLSTKTKKDFRLGEVSFGDEVDVIVLGAMRENAFYEGVYDPNNTAAPTCFALNTEFDEALMAPPVTLESRKADKCAGCHNNAFGSDIRGRGKACKNTVRLAVLYHENGQDWSKVEGARLRISPTSLGNWSGYVGQITKGLNRPLFSVVTRLHIEPDETTQFKLHFSPVGVYNDRETLDVLRTRVDEAELQLSQLPEAGSEVSTQAATPGGKQRRRKVVKKKVTRS